MTDLLALTAELVDVPSVSWQERAIADRIEAELTAVDGLSIDRVGDNVVARTQLGRESRVVLAGHTDTVPPNGNQHAHVDGDRLTGVGAADMKGGLAVMLDLARTSRAPTVDVTYVFYAREEIASEHSGLRELASSRPELLEGDVALLGEPTDGALEAGCQGTMRIRIVLRGARAHTARPWMGRNAVHRAAALLQLMHDYVGRRPVLDGCEYREALQAVGIQGGIAGNVVPDEVEILVNHRFAPDRTAADAEAHVRELVSPVIEPDDTVEVVDVAAGAAPGLAHPLLRSLIDRNRLTVRAKLGWTDVAFFAARGVPSANFGPGDSEVAHTADEWVTREQIDRVHAALCDLLGGPSART
jgi:succinyl-diaminopimelate desuccinylase